MWSPCEEALAAPDGATFDALISADIGLPDGDGWELSRRAKFAHRSAARDRRAVTKKLEKLIAPPGFTGSAPGGPSRWNQGGQEKIWHPPKPVLVVEVRYDHVTGRRFRHGAKLLRWRPDKAPGQCTMDQLTQQPSNSLRLLG
jgi:ATP-dependent DNA ligase